MGLFHSLMHNIAGELHELPLRLTPDGRLKAQAFRVQKHKETPNDAFAASELRARLDALDDVQALIEFSPEGEVLYANANFLGAVGYPLEALQGLHHCTLVAPEYSHNPEYSELWARLKRGLNHAHVCVFRTVTGDCFSASVSYAPLRDDSHRVVRVLAVMTRLPVLDRGRVSTSQRLNLPRSLGLSI